MAAHVYLGLRQIQTFSPTYDEPVHLTAGYIYLTTGDYRYNSLHHPAFGEMWPALPLLATNIFLPKQDPGWIAQRWQPLEQYQFADRFLYHNRVPADKMMQLGRLMQLLLSLFLGALIFTVALRLGGEGAAMMAAGLWAFSPTLLAHGTLISTDFAFATFFFAFFACVALSKSVRGDVLAGVLLGLCVASKYLAVIAGPALLLVWVVNREKPARVFKSMGMYAGLSLLVVLAIYRFGDIGHFFDGFSLIFKRSQAGRSSFFLGQHGLNGWLHYFPVTFLIKTPLPELAAYMVAAALLIKNRQKIPAALWIPPLLLFVAACFSKVQIGHRHILGIYPFLAVLAGWGISQLKGKVRWGGAVFIAWLAVVSFTAAPHFLSYFNETVGGSRNGYKYLTDSNVDWGQGLKELAAWLPSEAKEKGIYLSYFGVADPKAEGIRYLDVACDPIAGHRDNGDDPHLAPTLFAVSVTNLQGTYFRDRTFFKWLENFRPVAQISNSIFVYDFKDSPEARLRLSLIRSGN